MTEELVRKYVPHLRYDRCEPYALVAVGYTVYRESRKSVSCSLQVRVEPGETVLEYAFYYDFDIQHLYDLEHVFVTVGEDGAVRGVLGSFHGKFLNNLIPGETAFEDGHVVEYVQPGKHAFMPAPRYFWLAPDRDAVCSRLAGSDGLLIAPMFEGRIAKDAAFDKKVARYIREHHSFTPSWEFVKAPPQSADTEELLVPWEKLDALIVERIDGWKRRIEEAVEG